MAACFHGPLLRFCVSSSGIWDSWIHRPCPSKGVASISWSVGEVSGLPVTPSFRLAPNDILHYVWPPQYPEPNSGIRKILNKMLLASLPRACQTMVPPWAPLHLQSSSPCPGPLTRRQNWLSWTSHLRQWSNGQLEPTPVISKACSLWGLFLGHRHFHSKKLFELCHDQQVLKLKETFLNHQ